MNGNIALDRPSASSSSHGQPARAQVAQTRRFSFTPQTHDLRHDSSTVSARQCLVYINTLHSSTCLFIDEGFDGNPRSLIKYLFIFSCLLIGFQAHLISSWWFIFMVFTWFWYGSVERMLYQPTHHINTPTTQTFLCKCKRLESNKKND